MFSRACEMSLSSSHAKMELKEGRNDLISLIEELAAIASDILPYHKQSTLEALVTLIIHCRDVMTVLINNDICSAEDFAWTRYINIPILGSNFGFWDKMKGYCNTQNR